MQYWLKFTTVNIVFILSINICVNAIKQRKLIWKLFVDDTVSHDKKYSTTFNPFSSVDIVVLFLYVCVCAASA